MRAILHRPFAAFLLAYAALAAQAQGVALTGTMGSRALLVIDGQPQVLAVGDSARGVKLLSLDGDQARVDVKGQVLALRVGGAQVSVGGPAGASGREIVMTAGPGGHFVADGSINGRAVRFLVDTGATNVALSTAEATRLGIDWQRAMSQFHSGKQIDFNTSSIVKQPAGGVTPAANVFSLGLLDVATSGAIRLSAVIDALKQQGDVRVVSQPHIRTLNNQAGMIKVGTDRTFFRREQVTDTSAAGATTASSDVPQVVTEGIVLGLTPQISNDGMIMIDVYPVITRVSSVTQVVGDNGQVQSTAPNLDIRQSTSLVRAQSGETVVIGGLISDTNSDTTRGVPGLSDIPVAGNLFKGRYNQHSKQELVIFMTPKLVGPNLSRGTPLAQGGY